MTRKTFEEFRIEQTDEFQIKLRFLTLTNRSFRKLSDYKEKTKQGKW